MFTKLKTCEEDFLGFSPNFVGLTEVQWLHSWIRVRILCQKSEPNPKSYPTSESYVGLSVWEQCSLRFFTALAQSDSFLYLTLDMYFSRIPTPCLAPAPPSRPLFIRALYVIPHLQVQGSVLFGPRQPFFFWLLVWYSTWCLLLQWPSSSSTSSVGTAAISVVTIWGPCNFCPIF